MTVKVTKPAVNLREEISALKKPSGVAGEAILRAETPQEQFNLIGAGRKNILINGDFQVSQRGDYSSATVTSDHTYRLDRWYLGTNNNNSTVQRTTVAVSDSPESQYAQKCVAGSTATSYLGIRQKVENPARYAGKTVTYSGWVKSNHADARLTMYIPSPATIVTSNTHSGNGAWEKLSVTVKLPETMSGTWYVDVHISSATVGNTRITSGDYFEATDLQLELGKVATPFEYRSYGEELALCQRYYQKLDTGRIGGVINVQSQGIASLPLKLSPMRATATIGISGTIGFYYMSGGTQVNSTISSLASAANNAININKANGAGGAGDSFWCDLGPSAFIYLDAEL